MKHLSRRELREKLLAQNRRQWNARTSDDDAPVRLVRDAPPDVTFWDDPHRPRPLEWIPVVLAVSLGMGVAFAAGLGVGFLWAGR